jgi:GH15 family glucan-1,4-alpha-glucosidase
VTQVPRSETVTQATQAARPSAALEELGLVGNCQFAALISARGAVEWCCLPRFDSEPVFGGLLDPEGGAFEVGPAAGGNGRQQYLENTNVLVTTFETADGRFRVIDFAPRFVQYQRTFRPTQLIRIVEPLEGTPLVRVGCRPVLGWSKQRPERTTGSNHVRYLGFASQLRLTTDVPLSFVDGEPFALTRPLTLALTWGDPIEEPLAPLAQRFFDETVRHWRRWVKQCSIPPLFQREVIRSALALKLCCFEDTGAIVAAPTTSVPESPGSGRTWDYRYCWLRDAFYTLEAFRLLGQFEERERFIDFLLTIAARERELELKPLYRIDGSTELSERELPHWQGYEGHGPVRVGNGAAAHQQHDVFGEMALALTPIFRDERFAPERSAATWQLLERLATRALAVAGTPDTGLWELRTAARVHTFSSVMCWAGADRVATLAAQRGAASATALKAGAAALKERILAESFNPTLRSFAATHGGDGLDASLLQLATLRLLEPDDARLHSTIDAVRRELMVDGWLHRYRMDDGFGVPAVAFTICTYWLVDALARIGRLSEAREVLERTRQATPLGLIGEDVDPRTRRMWGNFPQAYSHVGLIHAAFAASPSWHEVL